MGVEEQIRIDPLPDLPVERGPDGAGVGSWVVQDKYRYLTHYLLAARPAMAKWSTRVYIDPFCATGRIQLRGESFTRPGGAAVAWHALESTGARWTRMLVGDIDGSRAQACAQRLTALGADATPFTGPATETVPAMAAVVPRGALCIAFIDPYNLALLDFSMLKALADLKVDLIIHFSTMDLMRNADMELDERRARFDLAAPGWRSQPWARSTRKANLPMALAEYWQQLVQGLGFNCSQAQPLITNDRHHGLYRLVFFARHDLPLRLWRDIASGPARGLFD